MGMNNVIWIKLHEMYALRNKHFCLWACSLCKSYIFTHKNKKINQWWEEKRLSCTEESDKTVSGQQRVPETDSKPKVKRFQSCLKISLSTSGFPSELSDRRSWEKLNFIQMRSSATVAAANWEPIWIPKVEKKLTERWKDRRKWRKSWSLQSIFLELYDVSLLMKSTAD